MTKTWIAGGLAVVLLGLFASGVPGRTVRWYRQVAAWEAGVTADSLRRAREDVARAALQRDIEAREARVGERERRDSATALALASRIAAFHRIRDLPDTCRPAVQERDKVIAEQAELLGRKDSTIADLIGQVRDQQRLRLMLEVDTTNMRRDLRLAKAIVHDAPVRPSLWDRVRPGVFTGYGAAGGPSGVQTGPAVLIGWKIL